MNTFYDEYWCMREIGRLFGKSSHEVGAMLIALGLRSEGKTKVPTIKARELGLVARFHERRPNHSLNTWHRDRTVAILQKAGWKVLPVEMLHDRDDDDDQDEEVQTEYEMALLECEEQAAAEHDRDDRGWGVFDDR